MLLLRLCGRRRWLRSRTGWPGRAGIRGGSMRRGWRHGSRWRRHGSRSPRCSGARPRSVVFTSGATESIASACWGAAERGGHQVLAAVEHSAVRLAAEAHGEVTIVGVDGHGRVDPDELIERGPRGHRPRPHPVGEPRGGHPPARRARSWPRAASVGCSCTSTPPPAPGTIPSPSTSSAPICCPCRSHKLGGPTGHGRPPRAPGPADPTADGRRRSGASPARRPRAGGGHRRLRRRRGRAV